MSNKINSIIACLFLFGMVTFTSCDKENIDIENTTEEETNTEVVLVDPETPSECDNLLTLNSDLATPLDLSATSEAILFKSACSPSDAPFTHNYLIVDSIWKSVIGDVNYYYMSDGIPAISFGKDGLVATGDILTPYSTIELGYFESIFNNPTNQKTYVIDDITVTIEDDGDEVGETLSGTISGTLKNQNDLRFALTQALLNKPAY